MRFLATMVTAALLLLLLALAAEATVASNAEAEAMRMKKKRTKAPTAPTAPTQTPGGPVDRCAKFKTRKACLKSKGLPIKCAWAGDLGCVTG